MNNFLRQNWYRLLTGFSLFLFAAGFFIRSVLPARAGDALPVTEMRTSGKYTYWIVAWDGYAYIFQSYDGGSPSYTRRTKLF